MEYITPEDYEIAEMNGISTGNVTQRVYEYGWDIERAIAQPLTVRRKVDPVWEKWKQIATKNGISKKLFNQRIKANGWTHKKAATEPITRGGFPSEYFTAEDEEVAKRIGISLNLARTRMTMLGWSKEDALNTPKMSEAERLKRVAEGTRAYHRRKKYEAINANG